MKWFFKDLIFQAFFNWFKYSSFFQTGFNVKVNARFLC
jgi:hypothetical protein